MRLHYLQHVSFENPGIILSWAAAGSHTVTKTLLYQGEALPEQLDFDWLVVMGGPMGVADEDKYPFLAKEKAFLKKSIESGKIVIGLCLGAQLIADVIGGKVTKNHYKEIGWFPVHINETARRSPLFSFFPPDPVVFQWHGDTFSTLPEKAVVIAGSEACTHQAFVYRDRVFGFQYHLENTLETIKGLIENCKDELIPDIYVQNEEEIFSHPEYIEQDNHLMTQFLNALLTL